MTQSPPKSPPPNAVTGGWGFNRRVLGDTDPGMGCCVGHSAITWVERETLCPSRGLLCPAHPLTLSPRILPWNQTWVPHAWF